MNAKEFEIAFYEAMYKWAAGGKVDPDPRGEWEYSYPSKGWRSYPEPEMPDYDVAATYRWKPAKKRMTRLHFADGTSVELVAPEVDAPAFDTPYYTECSNDSSDGWSWVIRARAAIPSTKGSNIELDTADELRDIAKNFGDALREDAEKHLKEQT